MGHDDSRGSARLPTPRQVLPLASLWIVVLALLSPGCSSADPADDGLPAGFPAEKTAADFPGIDYPVDGRAELPRPASLHGPVWLIGIDGATWDLIRPFVDAGDLPNFRALMDEGAHGTLLSEQPTISPAVWATIASGMPRFVHGIVNFIVKKPGSYDTVEVGPSDRRSPALWELVGAAGGSSAVISWFGSYPAERIRGHYISKRFDPENLQPRQVHPESFAEPLSQRVVVRMRRGDLQQIGWTEDLRKALIDDARTLAALRVIVDDGQPDFVAVYFAGIDIVQHLMWRHTDPASQQFPQDGAPDADLAQVIPAYYRYIDHSLGEIRELAPQNATLVVVSDHGGGPMRLEEAFHLQLPVLLEQLGLMQGNDGVAFAISELYRHDKRLWLNLAGVEAHGIVPLEEADEQARAIHDRLAGLRTDGGEPLFASVTQHTSDPAWQPGDPALTVRFSTAALFDSVATDGEWTADLSEVRLRLPDVSGSHRPEGILLLQGPGVRPGALPSPASMYQVAPTVLYLLGLPQDRRMLCHAPRDGGVVVSALDPRLLERHPIRMVPEYPGTDRTELLRSRRRAPDERDPAHDEAMEKLRSLGYIR